MPALVAVVDDYVDARPLAGVAGSEEIIHHRLPAGAYEKFNAYSLLTCRRSTRPDSGARPILVPRVPPGGWTMKAVRIHEHGGPDVLRYEEVPLPAPGRGEARIQVEAGGVNFPYHLTRLRIYQGT